MNGEVKFSNFLCNKIASRKLCVGGLLETSCLVLVCSAIFVMLRVNQMNTVRASPCKTLFLHRLQIIKDEQRCTTGVEEIGENSRVFVAQGYILIKISHHYPI